MVKKFDDMVDEIVEAVRAAASPLGIAPESVQHGGAMLEPPCVNVSVSPVEFREGERSSVDAVHIAEVGILLTVAAAASEKGAIVDALGKLAPIARAVHALKTMRGYFGISFVDVLVDATGKQVAADRTILVARFTFAYLLP